MQELGIMQSCNCKTWIIYQDLHKVMQSHANIEENLIYQAKLFQASLA